MKTTSPSRGADVRKGIQKIVKSEGNRKKVSVYTGSATAANNEFTRLLILGPSLVNLPNNGVRTTTATRRRKQGRSTTEKVLCHQGKASGRLGFGLYHNKSIQWVGKRLLWRRTTTDVPMSSRSNKGHTAQKYRDGSFAGAKHEQRRTNCRTI
jgi:hypothetical protein